MDARLIALLGLLGVTGCNRPETVDCTRINAAALKCSEENHQAGDKAWLLRCLPFSTPVRTRGVWVTGFEKNDFFEYKRPASIEETSDTELVLDEKNDITDGDPGSTEALEVDLIGRRTLCEFTRIKPHLIVVDKITVTRRIKGPR